MSARVYPQGRNFFRLAIAPHSPSSLAADMHLPETREIPAMASEPQSLTALGISEAELKKAASALNDRDQANIEKAREKGEILFRHENAVEIPEVRTVLESFRRAGVG